jgi:chromosome segregation ATPase
MPRKRDPSIRRILDKSKDCAEHMKDFAEVTDFAVDWTFFEKWRKAFIQINKAAAELEKRMELRERQHATELQLLREAMRNELIDREGNAARIAEKQRQLYDRMSGGERTNGALDNLPRAVDAVEQAMSQLSSVHAASSTAPDAIVANE